MDFTTSLRELFTLVATSSHSCLVLPPTNATHFDLKPHIIQLLPSFYGLDHENPYGHVKKFRNICAITKFQSFSEESVHLRLFPFSLHDRAMVWLDSSALGFISSILQCKLPIKYKDPGSLTITCMIGVSQIERALLDLGASVICYPTQSMCSYG